jgi:hypothetical protein
MRRAWGCSTASASGWSHRASCRPTFLPDDRFGVVLAEFLGASGWGSVQVSALSEAVMAIDTDRVGGGGRRAASP